MQRLPPPTTRLRRTSFIATITTTGRNSPPSLGSVHGSPFAFKSCKMDGSPGSSGEQRSSASSQLLPSSPTERSLQQPADSAAFGRVIPLAAMAPRVGALRRGCRSLQRSRPGSDAPVLADTDDVQQKEVFELCLSDGPTL